MKILDIFKSITPENQGKYSMGRIVLIVNVVVFLIAIVYGLITQKYETESFQELLQKLQEIILMFSGYVLGSKIINNLPIIWRSKNKNEQQENHKQLLQS